MYSPEEASSLQRLCTSYVHALEKNIDERFKDSLLVLGTFSVFDPAAVWEKFKYDLDANFKMELPQLSKTITPPQWCIVRVIEMESTFGHGYPLHVSIAKVVLVLPILNHGQREGPPRWSSWRPDCKVDWQMICWTLFWWSPSMVLVSWVLKVINCWH